MFCREVFPDMSLGWIIDERIAVDCPLKLGCIGLNITSDGKIYLSPSDLLDFWKSLGRTRTKGQNDKITKRKKQSMTKGQKDKETIRQNN